MTQDRNNARIIRRLLLVVGLMFGFGFAMVPLYDVFCDVTGLNGKTSGRVADVGGIGVDEARTVTVEFIANLNQGLPWEFRPEVAKIQVHPGQPTLVNFYAENRSDRTIVGRAVPSVAPGQAAQHFRKTECFCFTEQTFAPGEGRDMPVQFVVDPALPPEIEVVSLSYTFFEKAAGDAVQARAPGDATGQAPVRHN